MNTLSDMASKVKDIRLVPSPERNTSSEKKEKKEEGSQNENCNKESNKSQQQQRHPILQITSYDRFSPPSPKPDLQYDCRATQNPSRQIRKTCTGLDSPLQDELMRRDSFHDLYERAEADIRRLMEVKDVRASREGEVAIVRVGCLCGSGHHRSVAFAEKLGEIVWPEGWEVRVEHRDLTEGVEEVKRMRSEKGTKYEDI
jgi:RNase adaptor protein for sRNA GlmZ degradation